MTELGRLEHVDLRKVWEDEAGNFTPWLAEEENIKLLGDTIRMELEVHSTEKEVGPFRADILCKETTTGNWVLIENQLEKTDHTHLGQLMTYAAGLDAATVVWVAARFTEEHRAALDWLNDITGADFSFFGLEVEAWRIGNSPIAPKFNVVSKPNEWVRVVSKKKKGTGPLSDTQQMLLAYWSAFKEYLEESESILSIRTPNAGSWQSFAVGRGDFSLVAAINTTKKRVFCYLAMKGDGAKPHFHLLMDQQASADEEFGEPLDWRPMLEKKESHVHAGELSSDPTDEGKWPEQHKWLCDRLERLHQVFSPRVKTLDASDYVPEEDG